MVPNPAGVSVSCRFSFFVELGLDAVIGQEEKKGLGLDGLGVYSRVGVVE